MERLVGSIPSRCRRGTGGSVETKPLVARIALPSIWRDAFGREPSLSNSPHDSNGFGN